MENRYLHCVWRLYSVDAGGSQKVPFAIESAFQYTEGVTRTSPTEEVSKQDTHTRSALFKVWCYRQNRGTVFRLCVADNMKVDRREGESVDQLIRRFNKGVVAERITKIYRDKMHFISKSEQRKEKRRRAERNRRKKQAKMGH